MSFFLLLEKLFMCTQGYSVSLEACLMIIFVYTLLWEVGVVYSVVKVLAKFHFIMVSVFQTILQKQVIKNKFLGSDGYLEPCNLYFS